MTISRASTARVLRAKRDEVSVLALLKLLVSIVAKPGNYMAEAEIRNCLVSQGTLAAYSNSALAIVGMSLNHQKRVADRYLDSYSQLNELRITASKLLTSKAHFPAGRTKQNRASDRARIDELLEKISWLTEDLWLVQRAFDNRCIQARSYAAAASRAVQAVCIKEQREIDASLGLRKLATPTNKVVPFKRKP